MTENWYVNGEGGPNYIERSQSIAIQINSQLFEDRNKKIKTS